MKKILVVLAIAFFSLKGFSQQKNLKDLVGHWEIVGDTNNTASLDVVDSSTIILTYNGEKKKVLDYKAVTILWDPKRTSNDTYSKRNNCNSLTVLRKLSSPAKRQRKQTQRIC